jgi:hypothetical protein
MLKLREEKTSNEDFDVDCDIKCYDREWELQN